MELTISAVRWFSCFGLRPDHARCVESEFFDPLDNRVLIRVGLIIEDDVVRPVPHELLALPDEVVLIERSTLVLVDTESIVVVARVHVGFFRIESGCIAYDIPHVERGLMERRLLVARQFSPNDDAVQVYVSGFEQGFRSAIKVVVESVGHSGK